MRRFYDWLLSKTPDFWRTYYGQPDLIKLLAYAHSIEASKSAGYKYLQAYDLLDIDQHIPGTVRVWDKLEATNERQSTHSFWQYAYDLPVGWLSINLIYDKYVDPSIVLQELIDFEVISGNLYTLNPLPNVPLYISKGTRTSTRLADNFGRAFDYARYDGVAYRDNFGPLLSLMFKGATLPAIIAAFNVAHTQPVSKYSTENVIEVRGSKVLTDRYTYTIPAGQLIVAPGQYLPQHFPLTRTIDFSSYQHAIDFNTGVISPGTKNNWWVGKPAALFQKYSKVALTEESKDYLMDSYLKYFVSYLSVRQAAEADASRYEIVEDIKRLVYDGLPVRTDLILSQAMSIYYDDAEDASDWGTMASGAFDIWCGLNSSVLVGRNMVVEPFTPSYVYGELILTKYPSRDDLVTAQEKVTPTVYPESLYTRLMSNKGSGYYGMTMGGGQYSFDMESTYEDVVLWLTGSHRYLTLEHEAQQSNGYSLYDSIPAYFDLNYDYYYYRSYTESAQRPYDLHVELRSDLQIADPTDYPRLRLVDQELSLLNSVTISRASNKATITVASHGYTVGDTINVFGFSGAYASFNAASAVILSSTSTSITYASTGTNLGATSNTTGYVESTAGTSMALLDALTSSTAVLWSFRSRWAYNEVDLFGWDKEVGTSLTLAYKKISCALDSTATLTQPITRVLPIGHHAVQVRYTSVFTGPGLELQYRVNDGDWDEFVSPLNIPSSLETTSPRYLQLRYVFTASEILSPTLNQLIVRIEVLS